MILFPFQFTKQDHMFFLHFKGTWKLTTEKKKNKTRNRNSNGESKNVTPNHTYIQTVYIYVWGWCKTPYIHLFIFFDLSSQPSSYWSVGFVVIWDIFNYINRSLTHPRSGQAQLPFSLLSLSSMELLLEQSPLKKCLDPEAFGIDGERLNC